ncbi:MAG: ABC transporter ATP-binding protein [Gammaproteobacteria bacterium]|jgi:iron complex transport system ATP-binding protein
MPDTPPPLLRCAALDVSIGTVSVARNLGLTVNAGDCWCILGRNGCGKTTLLHTLAGLRPADAGRIELNGRPLSRLHRRQVARWVGVLFQSHEDAFPATVLDTVLQGRHPHLRAWQWETADDRAIARRALAGVGMSEFRDRNVQTLSGGERQRVAIASLLAQQPGLMLLDEPTNHLDPHHQLDVLENLVAGCREQGRALVMVLHDVNLASRFADHALLLLGDGEARLGETHRILETDLLERLYGHRLIEVQTPGGRAWLPA